MGRNVAIACQGGGSHTAFTAGVLKRLLPAVEQRGDALVGLSGTSGGAFAAAAAWYGSLAAGTTAPDRLNALWAELSASSPGDRIANGALVWGTRLETMGVPTPAVSPYRELASDWGRAELRRVIETVLDVEAIPGLVGPHAPELVVGAVDVTEGTFETFTGGDVTADALLASAAVPDLFEAVEIGGDYFWDGLFSQNPPIRDLFDVRPARKPDELWLIQINPRTRDGVPTTLRDIADRRNELSGNLSLTQALHTVELVNEFVAAGYLPEEYREVTIRRIEFDHDLGYASKLDRSPAFVEQLLAKGERAAERFLDGQVSTSVS